MNGSAQGANSSPGLERWPTSAPTTLLVEEALDPDDFLSNLEIIARDNHHPHQLLYVEIITPYAKKFDYPTLALVLVPLVVDLVGDLGRAHQPEVLAALAATVGPVGQSLVTAHADFNPKELGEYAAALPPLPEVVVSLIEATVRLLDAPSRPKDADVVRASLRTLTNLDVAFDREKILINPILQKYDVTGTPMLWQTLVDMLDAALPLARTPPVPPTLLRAVKAATSEPMQIDADEALSARHVDVSLYTTIPECRETKTYATVWKRIVEFMRDAYPDAQVMLMEESAILMDRIPSEFVGEILRMVRDAATSTRWTGRRAAVRLAGRLSPVLTPADRADMIVSLVIPFVHDESSWVVEEALLAAPRLLAWCERERDDTDTDTNTDADTAITTTTVSTLVVALQEVVYTDAAVQIELVRWLPAMYVGLGSRVGFREVVPLTDLLFGASRATVRAAASETLVAWLTILAWRGEDGGHCEAYVTQLLEDEEAAVRAVLLMQLPRLLQIVSACTRKEVARLLTSEWIKSRHNGKDPHVGDWRIRVDIIRSIAVLRSHPRLEKDTAETLEEALIEGWADPVAAVRDATSQSAAYVLRSGGGGRLQEKHAQRQEIGGRLERPRCPTRPVRF